MSDLKRLLRLALLCLAFAAMPGFAMAQNPSVDVNCNYVDDPDLAWRESICTAWQPCNLVNKIGRTCARTKAFLKSIGDVFTSKAKEVDPAYSSSADTPPPASLWDKIKAKLSTDDVAQAAVPATNNAALKANDAATDRLIADYKAARARSEGTLMPNGNYYEGAMKNGVPDGPGVRVRANGLIERGQFRNGELSGQGEYIYPKGDILAGRMGAGTIVSGASQTPDGTVRAGVFSNGYPVGKTEIEYPDGTSQVIYNDKTAKTIAEGPIAKPGEDAVEPPTPKGYPAEDEDEDYPLWSPSAPTRSIIEYSMLWGRDDDKSALDLAKKDPTTKDVIGDMAFCRPIMGSLTPEEEAACGIKPEPPPQQQAAQQQPRAQQQQQNARNNDDDDHTPPPLSALPNGGGIGGSFNGNNVGSFLGGLGMLGGGMQTSTRPLTAQERLALRSGKPAAPGANPRIGGIDCNGPNCGAPPRGLPPTPPPGGRVDIGQRPTQAQAEAMVARLEPQCSREMSAISTPGQLNFGGKDYGATPGRLFSANFFARAPLRDWYYLEFAIKDQDRINQDYAAMRGQQETVLRGQFMLCIFKARLRELGPAPWRPDPNAAMAGLRQTCAAELQASAGPQQDRYLTPENMIAISDPIRLRETMEEGQRGLPYSPNANARLKICMARARMNQLGLQ